MRLEPSLERVQEWPDRRLKRPSPRLQIPTSGLTFLEVLEQARLEQTAVAVFDLSLILVLLVPLCQEVCSSVLLVLSLILLKKKTVR